MYSCIYATYSKNSSAVKKGKAKKVQVTERLKGALYSSTKFWLNIVYLKIPGHLVILWVLNSF